MEQLNFKVIGDERYVYSLLTLLQLQLATAENEAASNVHYLCLHYML